MLARLQRLPTWLREHTRDVTRIARWEVSRGVGSVDRTTAILGVVSILVSVAVVGTVVATGAGGLALDEGVYRVAVDDDSQYHEVVKDRPALTAKPPGADDVDLRVLADGRVRPVPGQKGQAALAEFRAAVQAHNDRLLAGEANQSAAFPVLVDLRYESRADVGSGGETGGGGDGGGTGSGADGGSSDGSGDTDFGSVGAGGGGAGGDGDSGGSVGVPGFGGGLVSGGDSGSPADIDPPFPFESLILAFAFLVPMNFVIQAYGSTILDERIGRRGELLLVSPVTPGDIVAGKTAPYLLGMVAVTTGIALAIGGGLLSVVAVVPVALLFLSATFTAGMFARSFKELTFVTVAISTFLTSYAFVPAIFADVTPIALISPLTLVVRDLQGGGATLVEYLFSTGPFYFGSSVLFLLGLGVYREEDMFTQRPVPLKVLDALDSRLRGASSVAVLSGLFIPFVFIAELLAVAVLFALPIDVSVPLLLVTIAGVEEVAKSVHVYAGFEKARFERTVGVALVLGVLSGLGFFVGEKLTVVVQLIGLPELPLGEAAFAPSGVGVAGAGGGGPSLAFTLALLLAPLALHAVTASLSALGARANLRWYGVGLSAAVVVHAAYNLAVVSLLG
nr:PrsW family intramembrane metalloprotease [Salinirubrum litoreum]